MSLVPKKFFLAKPKLSPFRRHVEIRFGVPKRVKVRICVYDIAGRLVRTFINGPVKPGYYWIRWDGKDSRGRDLASGIYFLRMEAKGFGETEKLLLLK